MSGLDGLREGMQVYGADKQLIGTVERRWDTGFQIGGTQIPADAIERVTGDTVHLKLAGAALRARRDTDGQDGAHTAARGAEVVVPVAEERLQVGKQVVELGAVEVRKTVAEEEVSFPISLQHDELRVEQRNFSDRPIGAADAEHLFAGGPIRIPMRGEEAVVTTQAFVTGEVVIDRSEVVERREVTDTVRVERVDVVEQTAQPGADRGAAATAAGPVGRESGASEPEPNGEHERTGGGADGAWEALREEIHEAGDRARD